MKGQSPLGVVRAIEAQLLARRAGDPDPVAAVSEALSLACDGAAPEDIAAAGRAIAAAVEAHGAGFAAGREPAYHGRHHQVEATLCAGRLAAMARRQGLLAPREAALLVLALAGHDLLHDGAHGTERGALERRSAAATLALAAGLPAAEQAVIARLILATIPDAAPDDLPGRLVREADLFGSLMPTLGWRLSEALAAEQRAPAVATHAGRLALLGILPAMTRPAVALGLEAARSLQVAALAHLGGGDPASGAARLDAMPSEAAMRCWAEALAAAGLPGMPT